MFSFLTKSDKPAYTDKVWQTRQACFKGIAMEALNAIRNSKTAVVFFFFDEIRQKFIQFLDSNGITHQTIAPGTIIAEGPAGVTILLVNAFALESNETADWLHKRSRASVLSIFFLGHYPVAGPEDRLLEKLRQGIGPAPIVFGLSLEDPLFENLGTDRLKTLMETLGVKEDECIEHAIVSKAISRARKNLEAHVIDERRTATESEWFTRNIKQQL